MNSIVANNPEPRAWDVNASARYVGLSVSIMNKKRCDGTGPKFIRTAPNRISYLKEDLDSWLDSRPKLLTTADASEKLVA